MSCTCVKDHTITCRVHPLEYEQIEVMGKHIAKLQAVVDAAKPLLVLQLTDGIERYEAEQALEQAIKEVEGGD